MMMIPLNKEGLFLRVENQRVSVIRQNQVLAEFFGESTLDALEDALQYCRKKGLQ